jgi:hypothetical protein
MIDELNALNSDSKNVSNNNDSSLSKCSTKQQTKWQEIKHVFLEWSKEANFDCYPKVFQKQHKALRAIWLILFLFFSCLTFWILYRNINEYFQYETVSKISIKHERYLMFPTVTFCDANPFTTKESEELFRETAEEEFGLEFSFFTMLFNMYVSYTEIIKLKASSFNDNQKQRLGFNIR